MCGREEHFLSRILTRTDERGIVTTYCYNNNNRLIDITYSDGTPDVVLTYDDYYRLTAMQEGADTYQFTYYANSWLESIDGPWTNDTNYLQL